MSPASTVPSISLDERDPERLRLRGRWTLEHANHIGETLRTAPEEVRTVDATAVDRLS